MSHSIQHGPPQPLLTVRGISRRTLTDEATKVLCETRRSSKAANTEGEKNPASSMRGFGGVHTQLFADLTVDLISTHNIVKSIENYILAIYNYHAAEYTSLFLANFIFRNKL